MNSPDLFIGLALIIGFVIFGVAALQVTQQHRNTLDFQIRLFLYALVARFAASIVIYQFGLVKILGDEDATGWYGGVLLNRKWQQQGVGIFDLPGILAGAFEGTNRGYHFLVGTMFYITGEPDRMVAAALNCFLGAITVVFVYRIALSLFSWWTATYAGWLACFFPSLIIWSAQTVKEPVVIFLETVALYACVHLKIRGFALRYILLCVTAVIFLLPFRFYAAYLAGAAAMAALVIPQIGKRKSSIFSAIAVSALIVPIVISSGMLARSEAQFERFSQIKEIEKFKVNIAAGAGSGVNTRYDLNSPTGLITGTAVGAAHLLLAPFPWQLGGASLRMALVAPELLVWWWLVFVGLIPGMWYCIRTRFSEIQPMLFFILGLGLLYSMMFGNIGLIVRQRAQILPWLLIIAVVGLEQRSIRRLTKKNGQTKYTAVVPVKQVQQS